MSLVDTSTGEAVVQCDHGRATDLTDGIRSMVGRSWELIIAAYRERAWATLGYSSWDTYCEAEFDGAQIKIPREERIGTVQSLRDAGLSTRAIAAATGTSDGTVRNDLRAGAQNYAPDKQPSGPVTGTDGKQYPSTKPPRPEPLDPERRERIAEHLAAHPDHSLSTAARATDTDPADVLQVRNEQNVGHPNLSDEPDDEPTPPPSSPKPRRSSLPDAAERAGWDFRRAVERIERIVADDRFPANREQVAARLRGHLTYATEVMHDLMDGFDTDPTEDR